MAGIDSQVSATAQLLMDPYYRTIDGFSNLITKDFIAFGFQFKKRGDGAVGNAFEKGESSPIFGNGRGRLAIKTTIS